MPNVLIWAWYFWKKDVENGHYFKDPETYLRQNFQKFIYRLNQPFLRIDQCAFTNVSIFDRPYLESLFGGIEFPDGTFAIDHIEELIKCQQIFMDVIDETREENMFTFPVLTYSLLYKDGKFQDEVFARWCSDHNMKWSDSNFFVSDNVGVLSNCCRLLSETTKLDAFINSIGGTALSVGSCRVSTINLVRIAHESKLNKKKYLDILRDRVTLDCKALYSMRHILQRNIEKGLLPNYQDGAVELDKQFCTIGGIGMYEVMDMFGLIHTDEFGNKSYSDEAVEFATQILDVINNVKDNFECDFTFNLEMIPAENCAGVICTADNLLYEQNKYYIYSNQWIPLTEQCTIQEKCRLGSIFDKKCGGGCIAHINIENRFVNSKEAWDMLNYVAKNGVIYFAFTTKISVCEDKHAFIGTNTCPKCGKPVSDQYARVVGFYTPVSSYQKIRKREFNHRRWYDVLNKDGIMQMKLKGIVMEDFVNFSKPSLFLITSQCDWKCCKEQNVDISICQNQPLCKQSVKDFSSSSIYKAYISNDITKAIVFGGLEPMLQFDEVYELISYFRENGCEDTFVIYTGYYPEEIQDELKQLQKYKNIIIKFGRFIPGQEPHYDEVLGVYLASDNQYGEVLHNDQSSKESR